MCHSISGTNLQQCDWENVRVIIINTKYWNRHQCRLCLIYLRQTFKKEVHFY